LFGDQEKIAHISGSFGSLEIESQNKGPGKMVQFEWDAEKAKRNAKKHGVHFGEAATVFFDPLSATFDDPDHSEGEHRFITVGISSRGRLLVVAHTEKMNSIRIINARVATAHERRRHESKEE